MRSDFKDITGYRYGRLTVLGLSGKKSGRNRLWECRCNCGALTCAEGGHLRTGRHQSCGCLQREVATKHGMERTKTYMAWAQMKSRCSNPSHKSWKDYGGRGITVCSRWLKFEPFLEDMGEVPPGKSIGRIRNDHGYEPSNCRWEDQVQQMNNTQKSAFLMHMGRKQTVTQWARELGVSPITLLGRKRRGWTADRVITTPIDKRYSTRH